MSIHSNRGKDACRFGVAVLLALLLINANACRSHKENKEEVSNRDINAVMSAHVNELMAIPGVVGVAVGEQDDKTPCIQVLVIEKTEEIDRRVPKKIEGHPVSLIVSGQIRPMQGN